MSDIEAHELNNVLTLSEQSKRLEIDLARLKNQDLTHSLNIDFSVRIGFGMHGNIFKGVNQHGKAVAVKVFGLDRLGDSSTVKMQIAKAFIEFNAGQQFQHLNIIYPLDMGVFHYSGNLYAEKDYVVIVYPLYEKDTLELHKFDNFNALLTVMKKIYSALLAINTKGYEYRDVKLENILIFKDSITKDIEPILCDLANLQSLEMNPYDYHYTDFWRLLDIICQKIEEYFDEKEIELSKEQSRDLNRFRNLASDAIENDGISELNPLKIINSMFEIFSQHPE